MNEPPIENKRDDEIWLQTELKALEIVITALQGLNCDRRNAIMESARIFLEVGER